MWPIVADGVAWSVGHDSEPFKNSCTDRDIVWDVDSGGFKEPALDGGAYWRHMANTIEPPVCGRDAAFCQITSTTCFSCYRNYTVGKLH